MPQAHFSSEHAMRRFLRHPADIPIEVKAHGQAAHDIQHTTNLSIGGLAFRCDREFSPGVLVDLCIPFVQPAFEVEAFVAWCRKSGDRFELGVEFLNQDDAFMARMVEQICQIETYQKEVYRAEGRLLTVEEAAAEWISKYAAKFPGSAGKQ